MFTFVQNSKHMEEREWLREIGVHFFIDMYDDLKAYSNGCISEDSLKEKVESSGWEGMTKRGFEIRADYSKRIFTNNKQVDVLQFIVDKRGIWTSIKIKNLLNREKKCLS
ncbi:MAG: hypothetical protein OXC61_10845 [Flavobacteriaceae bacterium]|nr:hypothetical protein [Flavobacteriaceae bacterium]